MMKFHIYSDKFERTAQYSKSGETIPLRAIDTKKCFFLPLKAEKILKYTDTDVDFDGIAKNFTPEEKEACLDALVLFECFGAAQILKETVPSGQPVIRVAGERDYRALAEFYAEHMPELGFNQDTLRAWQFNNFGYSFIYRVDEKIKAAVIFEVPDKSTYSKTLTLLGAGFSDKFCNEDKKQIFKDMFEYAVDDFNEEFLRVRYIAVKGADEFIKELLAEEDFSFIGELKAETPDGKDVEIFDKDLNH